MQRKCVETHTTKFGKRGYQIKANSFAREEKERIEKERGIKQKPRGMSWGINSKNGSSKRRQ